MATLRELTNPVRRRLFNWMGRFFSRVWTARRGAAAGLNADNLFSILECEADSELLVQVVSKLAVGDVPDEVIVTHPGGSVDRIGTTRWRREGDRGRRHHPKKSC